MNSNCKNINPLSRSGVNQYNRVLNALLPEFASVDERDDADLILFAKNYAEQLKYFSSQNSEDGNWSVFMSFDVSVTLASLAKTDVKKCFSFVKNKFNEIKITDSETDAKNYFKELFDFGCSIINFLDENYNALPEDSEFKGVLKSSIQSNYPQYLIRLTEYYKSAIDETLSETLIDPAAKNETLSADCPVSYLYSQDFDFDKFSNDDLWKDESSFKPTFNGSGILHKIKNTCSHNLFTGIFDSFLESLVSIVDESSEYLEKTLSEFPSHSPHYALYLTFIKLFRNAQDHLNGFTKNHLDLYYKEILQLKTKSTEPDNVHLIFELQKNIDEHQIKKGTVFKAGKDTDSKEIFYTLTEDVIINTGKVKELRNIFVKKNTNSKEVFACPIANSEDGFGAKLESSDGSWNTFGDDNNLNAAEIGFAIASSHLNLNEGTRIITFIFNLKSEDSINFDVMDINNLFILQLTGEEGWIDINIDPDNVTIQSDSNSFQIEVTLDGGVDAVVQYSKTVHQYNFDTELPVAKFLIKDAKAAVKVWDFKIENIEIKTEVSSMKDFTIQNDQGPLSTSKPFEIFGSSPLVGSSFIVGCKELFVKAQSPNGKISGTINLRIDNYDDFNDKQNNYYNGVKVKDHTINMKFLEKSNWVQQSGNTELKLFNNLTSSTKTSTINFTLAQLQSESDFTENEFYSVQTKWGFLKLELNEEFGHRTYSADLTEYILSEVTETTGQTKFGIYDMRKFYAVDPNIGNNENKAPLQETSKPNEPYTPKIKDITIGYNVSILTDFSLNEECAFFQITPFGSKKIIKNNSTIPLLSAFENEGELFIGIENISADQTISVLFQVAEGSSDPLAPKQGITWYYLGIDNEWEEFEKEDIADGTDDLANSGIIKFNISKNAVLINTLMSDQIIWIRGTVTNYTIAVSKLITVTSQAAKVQYYDYNGINNYFKNTLPADSISKLVVSDSAVKKISQPYSSFNGNTLETDDHYYTRVSERLRHKNRSITIWDYERMVLEEFPEIFKVKCINHTQIISDNSVLVDNELKPGYVTVVTIPDLKNKNAFDPLRPNTSIGLLTNIKKYLYKYISPHVNLEVQNPRFEEIQLDFKAKFMTEDNEFYSKLLKEELVQFLAPWAFDETTDIEFGGKISKSVLIDFIEERSYVDFISCVKMNHIAEEIKTYDVEEAIATSSRSVFVSVKVDGSTNDHIISNITEDCEC